MTNTELAKYETSSLGNATDSFDDFRFRTNLELRYITDFEGKRLKHPLKVEITYESDGYLAYCEELNIYSTGDTIHEAFKEFIYEFKNHYSELKNTPSDELSADALRFISKIDDLTISK